MAEPTTIDGLLDSLGTGTTIDTDSDALSIDELLGSLGGGAAETADLSVFSIDELLSQLGGQQTPTSVVTPTGGIVTPDIPEVVKAPGIEGLISQLGQEPTTPLNTAIKGDTETPLAPSKLGDGFIRGFIHGALGIPKAGATALEVLGSFIEKPVDVSDDPLALPLGELDEANLEQRESIGRSLREGGKSSRDYWDELQKRYEPSEDIQGSILESPELLGDWGWWTYNIGDMGASLAAAILPGAGVQKAINVGGKVINMTPIAVERLARIGGAMVGGLAGGALEGTGAYEEMLEKSDDQNKANSSYIKMTLAATALNAISLGRLLKKKTGVTNNVLRWVTDGAVEGITEWLEEPAQAIINDNDIIQAMKDGVNVLPVAFLLGLGGSATLGSGKKEAVAEITPTSEVNLAPATTSPLGEEITQLIGELGGRQAPIDEAGIDEILASDITDEEVVGQILGEAPAVAPEAPITAPERPVATGTPVERGEVPAEAKASGIEPQGGELKDVPLLEALRETPEGETITIKHYARKYRPKHDKPTSFFDAELEGRTTSPERTEFASRGMVTPNIESNLEWTIGTRSTTEVVEVGVPKDKIYEVGSNVIPELENELLNSPDYVNDTRHPIDNWLPGDRKSKRILEENGYEGFRYHPESRFANEIVILDRRTLDKYNPKIKPFVTQLKEDITEAEAEQHLLSIGTEVMKNIQNDEGKTDLATFTERMKLTLGDLWEQFKSFVSQIYTKLREERGSIEFGREAGEAIGPQAPLRKTTKQPKILGAQPEGKVIPEKSALRRSLQRQVQVARKAQSEGKTEALTVAKRKIAIIKNKLEGKVGKLQQERQQVKEAQREKATEAKDIRKLKLDVVRKLNILPSSIRGKFVSRITKARTIETLGRIGNDINVEVAIQENRKEAKAQRNSNQKEVKKQKIEAKRRLKTKKALRARIIKVLKRTRPKSKGGKKQGRFTPEVEKVLKTFREAANMEESAAADRILELLSQYPDTIAPDEVRLEVHIINSVHGFSTQTVEELTKLLKDVIALRDDGKIIADLRKFNRESILLEDIEHIIDDLTGEEGIPDSIGSSERAAQIGIDDAQKLSDKAISWMKKQGLKLLPWNNLMDSLSGRSKSKQEESNLSKILDLSKVNRAEKQGLLIWNAMFTDLYQRTFRISTAWNMIKKMKKDSKLEDLGTFKDLKGRSITLKFSRAEARKRWMEFQDPTLDDTFTEGMGWTPQMKSAVTGMLTPQDIAFAKGEMKLLQEYYVTINEVYRRVRGIDLQLNPNYSPIKREGGQADFSNGFGEFLGEFNTRATVGGRSLQTRKRSRKPIKEQSDLTVFAQHVVEMEHFKAWAEKINDLNHIFKNPRVLAAIRLFHGNEIMNPINHAIAKFTRNGTELSGRVEWMDNFRANVSKAVLALKTVIGLKQLTSHIAFMETIPVSSYTKNSVLFWKNPIKNFKDLWDNSVFLRDRWKRQSLERDLRQGFKSEQFSAYSANPSFINLLMLNVRLGDIGAVIAGGWTVYKHHLDKGESVEEAIVAFEKAAGSAQQSSDFTELSQVQSMGSFAQLFTQFMSAPLQMVAKEIQVTRNLVQKRATIQQTAKTLAIYHVMIPLFFQMVADAFDVDQDDEEFLGVPTSWWRAVILGPMNSIPLLGDLFEGVIRKSLGERVYDAEVPAISILDDIYKAMALVNLFDLDNEELIRAVRGALSAYGKAKGIPLQTAFDITSSVHDAYVGEWEKALLKTLGFSPYIAEKIAED